MPPQVWRKFHEIRKVVKTAQSATSKTPKEANTESDCYLYTSAEVWLAWCDCHPRQVGEVKTGKRCKLCTKDTTVSASEQGIDSKYCNSSTMMHPGHLEVKKTLEKVRNRLVTREMFKIGAVEVLSERLLYTWSQMNGGADKSNHQQTSCQSSL